MSWTQERREKAKKKLRLVERGKLLQRTDPLATAFHEAAHAVFSEGFGMPVLWATCYPFVKDGDRLLGYVKSQEGAVLTGPEVTVHTLAGDIAEYPLLFGSEYEFSPYMSASDGEEIIKIWEAFRMDLSASGAFGGLKNAAEETAKLVRQTMRWITPVAIELYAHKTIQGEHLRAILNDFFTPENPLLQFHLQSVIKRLFCIVQKGGLQVPPIDEDGSISTDVLQNWFLDNATLIQPLLLDTNAEWNQKIWGDGQGQALSFDQIEQLVTCSNILKTFGVPSNSLAVG